MTSGRYVPLFGIDSQREGQRVECLGDLRLGVGVERQSTALFDTGGEDVDELLRRQCQLDRLAVALLAGLVARLGSGPWRRPTDAK